jgi:hypothetical protein
MIQKQTLYTIQFTEQQARELYQVLDAAKTNKHLTHDMELVLIYNELKPLFNSGIRSV